MSAHSKKTKFCPRIGKSCLEDKCVDWVAYPVDRVNKLTGAVVTEAHYMCLDHWRVKIAFDSARFADHAGAAIESFRNAVKEGNDQTRQIMLEHRHNATLPRQ